MTRTIVIIGASTGLGRATARTLAREHQVIVAGRDLERTQAAVPGARALRVDLADLTDVQRFGRELRMLGPIHGLVCNAGQQDTGAPTFTRDGHESTFAINHLAHFMIVMSALPVLAPAARVVLIGSGTLEPDGATLFKFRGARYTDARSLARGDGDPGVDDGQRARDRYATSKLCNLLTMAAIARRAPQLSVLALDPGLMPGTGLARRRGPIVRLLWHTVMRAAALVMPGASSARRSAAALAWLITSPQLAGTTGRYFDFRRREHPRWTGFDRTDWADELYTTSLELCGLERDPLAGSPTETPRSSPAIRTAAPRVISTRTAD
jgi:NAD(P)-dependent dehydrogenase (short-subunit alcohol dehydrogenase family)